jgi:cytochrome c
MKPVMLDRSVDRAVGAGRVLALLMLALLSALGGAGCAKAEASVSAGQLAAAGQAAYREQCASCHGYRGEGGSGQALIGRDAELGKFETADALYDFVRVAMPKDAPGSLSAERALQVVSFLLVENQWMSAEQPLNESGLSAVQLAR